MCRCGKHSRSSQARFASAIKGSRATTSVFAKVAEAIARLDRVEACQAVPWSHRLTIDFRPENGVSDWFLDQAERSFEDVLAAETRQPTAYSVAREIRAERAD